MGELDFYENDFFGEAVGTEELTGTIEENAAEEALLDHDMMGTIVKDTAEQAPLDQYIVQRKDGCEEAVKVPRSQS